MPGVNLTRDEAAERARILSVDSYDVILDLTTSETTFASTTTVAFTCREPGASTFIDLVDATVHSVTLNGREIPTDAYADSRIALDDLAADNTLTVVADCAYSRSGEGLHRFVDPADGRVYTYTQFEVPDARRVYASFEQPDLKATFTFTVTAPAGWKVASNSPTPEPTAAGEGQQTWAFAATDRVSTYITAIVAGEYAELTDVYEGSRGSIDLSLLVRESLLEHTDDEIFTLTKQGFAFFEDTFDMAYPFSPHYTQAFVPEYNMGAMENAGCVTYRDEYIFRGRETRAAYAGRANTILHEMAHMWFGDLVTMKWWDDLWLNESFAEWAATHASVGGTEYTDAWTNFCNQRKTWAYRQDQLPSTHPIAADNYDLEAVEVNFDGITYAKGASSLRQLVAFVGEENFIAGLRQYFREHAFGNTELSDLLGALEAASGRDLATWAQEWLQTSGVNTMAAEFTIDDTGAFSSFAVRQSAHADWPTLRRHRMAIGLYDLTGDGLVLRRRVETDVAGDVTEIPALEGEAQPDLLLLNDGDLTYAKVRFDERSLQTLVGHLADMPDSLARALCWTSAWDMTRDGQMRTTDWVEFVLRGIATETDLFGVSALIRQTDLAISSYADPGNRPALSARWERGLRELVDAADAGSDVQLALVRGLATAAASDEGAAFLTGLLDGSTTLPGLDVDTSLRWQLVQGLAANGHLGTSEIDAELARDNTITGQESAAEARASLPNAETKAAAWQAAADLSTPNETLRSIAVGFQQPGQEDLLGEYVQPYLDRANTAWEDLGVFRASSVLSLMFPRQVITPEVRETVAAWLESTSANPAAKRPVREGLDGIDRALRAQACDRG